MSFLRRLFGSGPSTTLTPATASSPERVPEFQMLQFEGRFYEDVSSSANGRFTLALTDSSPDGRVAGHRGGGQGAWVLFDGKAPVTRGRLQRPNDGAISDIGRCIVTDWLFTDRLESRFYAFEPDGRVILDVELGANAGDSAISTDGRFAAITTASNPGRPEWSNLLLAFDLDRAAELWRLPVGRTLDVAIDGEEDLVSLAMHGSDAKRTVRLSTGEQLEGWDEPLNKFDAVGILEAEVKAAPDDASAQESRIARARALVTEFADYPGWQARLLKVEGEALERLGQPSDAKAAYLRGLELDPQLGVKRRLAALGVETPAVVKAVPSSVAIDERPYASTACPSCGTTLDPLPKAKRKCPHCGEFIWVRGHPDGMRHLLKEDQLEANDLAWTEAAEAVARAQEEAGERQRALDRAAVYWSACISRRWSASPSTKTLSAGTCRAPRRGGRGSL